jgi:hypothetical protein
MKPVACWFSSAEDGEHAVADLREVVQVLAVPHRADHPRARSDDRGPHHAVDAGEPEEAVGDGLGRVHGIDHGVGRSVRGSSGVRAAR